MKPTTSLKFVLSYLLLVLCLGCSKASMEDEVISVKEDDAEMKAAIAMARSKLQEFWDVFKLRPNGESDFSLKVHLTDGDASEHFWVTDIERTEDKIFGTIDNEPEFVHTVKLGQRIEVPDESISDWRYMRDGKMVGNFTESPQ